MSFCCLRMQHCLSSIVTHLTSVGKFSANLVSEDKALLKHLCLWNRSGKQYFSSASFPSLSYRFALTNSLRVSPPPNLFLCFYLVHVPSYLSIISVCLSLPVSLSRFLPACVC